MSFEAYLGCFRDGEQSYFPTSIVDDAFAPFITRREPEFSCWVVTYEVSPTLAQADLYLNLDPDDASRCSGFTVARPPDDPRLYKALWGILRVTNSAVYCAGECPPMVGRAETIPHLNPDMVEALGSPVVVVDGDEIRNRLEQS
ncbi:hypothetical protein GCM10010869_33570 [Mesorhizobium tianshanense]|uniref:Uncharacterized protein n=1 Tax=Mesorhizobium tianshanense TaxID=39844 RepID=A0A562P508_9HYPH|nr:hypothetical protein [Mesorhizobium tianshanense]TWI39538.1 hypothetical protein IQ26_01768 [Mesorhizobium tianshanense]GLS37763.1 hypothetical protein GCM10010869_33570 [Mesorhizobium tianshanense]